MTKRSSKRSFSSAISLASTPGLGGPFLSGLMSSTMFSSGSSSIFSTSSFTSSFLSPPPWAEATIPCTLPMTPRTSAMAAVEPGVVVAGPAGGGVAVEAAAAVAAVCPPVVMIEVRTSSWGTVIPGGRVEGLLVGS